MQTDSSFTFVLFGGTGDLSMRKILPALYEAHRAGGMLAESGRIVAVARHAEDRDGYLRWVNENVKSHVSKNGLDEAAWASFLRRIDYVKLDLGKPEDFALLRPCPPVDLLVCSDVMHYVPTRALDRGLPGLAALCGGVAFLETFAREDQAEGDEDGFIARPARFYRRRFEALGFTPLGSHCWLSPALAGTATALEVPA